MLNRRQAVIMLMGVGALLALPPPLGQAAPARGRTADGKPRLVVMIVIEQFRQDFLTRFAPYFESDGFLGLRRRGASFTGAHYRHAATAAGPGHAVVASGSYGHRNGIVAGNWYNRAAGRREAILHDPQSRLLGVDTAASDGTSPRNFIGSALGDQLKLATGGRAKVISITLNDGAGILLGGRLGKAYWFHENAGGFLSSTYYAAELPAWVQKFNARRLPDSYFGRTWDHLLSPGDYSDNGPDDALWETDMLGLGRAFPRRLTGGLQKPGPDFYSAFLATPWATEYELAFAQAAIEAEGLGADETTDLLAISLTASGRAGHAFGPNSHEIQDLIVRADRQLADFLRYLTRRFGTDGVLVVLTADHGVAPVPEFAARLGLDAGRISTSTVRQAVTRALNERYGEGEWVAGLEELSIYLNHQTVAARTLDREEVARAAGEACMAIPGMAHYFTREQLRHGPLPPTDLAAAAERSFHPERSGDLILIPKPYHFWSTPHGATPTGTTCGTPYEYDTHVPLMIAGPGVREGEHHRFVDMADLAPTLATLLGIQAPAACEGRVIPEVIPSR